MSARRSLQPVKAAAASWWSVVLALVLAGVGVVLVHDAAIGLKWSSGDVLLANRVAAIHGVETSQTVLAVAVVVLLLGIVLFGAAFSPRKPTAYQIDAAGEMWLKFSGAELIAQSVVQDVEGVLSARATAYGKRLDVVVVTSGENKQIIKQQSAERVTQALAALENPPRVSVRCSG